MNTIRSQNSRSATLWPYGIIATFIVFASGLAAYVSIACSNDVELVARDYYQQEIEYERQMEKMARTNALGEQVSLAPHLNTKGVTLSLPSEHADPETQGTIHFYYPANVAEDVTRELSISERGTQEIDLSNLKPGFWRVKIDWTHKQEDFYFTQELRVSEQTIAIH